ncbi:MAG: hypothetical protein IJD54_02860, partial [Clostridia bacterium]|nr:hypothetical protein [Clostridia bacterium]
MSEKRTNEEMQEYSRLQEELIARLNSCYGDGAVLASFFLIYFATLIGGLFQCFGIKDLVLRFIVFGLVSSVAFFFPIIILHAFAVKFKENFTGLCNVALFVSYYHERPNIVKDKNLKGIKWELMHKNTMSFASLHESKEYFLLAFTSFILLIISTVVAIYFYITDAKEVTLFSLIPVAIVYVVLLYLGAKFLRRIYCVTDMARLIKIREDIQYYYQLQIDKFGEKETEQDRELFQSVLAFNKEEEILSLFLILKGIPDYEASGIIKEFHGDVVEIEDKHLIKFKQRAAELGKSLHDYIIIETNKEINKRNKIKK